jgi:hypothetical protein
MYRRMLPPPKARGGLLGRRVTRGLYDRLVSGPQRRDPVDVARGAGFEPLEPYPGNNRSLWACRHVSCGREIQLKLGSLTAGKNPCRYCNGQWVDPHLAADVMRQAGFEPLEPYVSNKAPWRCRCITCGRESLVKYNSVTSQGSGCKYCGRVRGGLKRRIPESEAVAFMVACGYQPLEPYVGSTSKWRCLHVHCGREIETTLSQLRGGNGACRHCAGLVVEPEQALEVMRMSGYEPLEPYVNSSHKWRCKCTVCGRESSPTYDQARTGSRCKYCAKKALTPEDAVERMRVAGFDPLTPYPGSSEPWMCVHLQCGEIVTPRYSHIQQGRRGCPTCSRALMAELFAADADEAAALMRLSGLEPLEPYPGRSNLPWRCRHVLCGREVAPTYASITQGQGGCRPCAQERLGQLFRIPDDEAQQVMADAGFLPLTPYPGRSHQPWKSRCTTCERSSSPTLSNVKNGARCIYCQGKKLDPKEVIEFMRRAGLEPMVPYPGRNSADWLCRHIACGREVTTRYSLVRGGNSGCVYCNGARIHEDDAAEYMRQRGLEPVEPYPGSSRPWRCVHAACGQEVTPTYANVAGGSGGCKFCSDSSFDYGAPGLVYLLRHPDFFALKIGISTLSARTLRVREHQRYGWELVKLWETESGLDAELIEQAVLGWWRNEKGVPPAVERAMMPSGGHTETASMIHVDTEETIARVQAMVGCLVLG